MNDGGRPSAAPSRTPTSTTRTRDFDKVEHAPRPFCNPGTPGSTLYSGPCRSHGDPNMHTKPLPPSYTDYQSASQLCVPRATGTERTTHSTNWLFSRFFAAVLGVPCRHEVWTYLEHFVVWLGRHAVERMR